MSGINSIFEKGLLVVLFSVIEVFIIMILNSMSGSIIVIGVWCLLNRVRYSSKSIVFFIVLIGLVE